MTAVIIAVACMLAAMGATVFFFIRPGRRYKKGGIFSCALFILFAAVTIGLGARVAIKDEEEAAALAPVEGVIGGNSQVHVLSDDELIGRSGLGDDALYDFFNVDFETYVNAQLTGEQALVAISAITQRNYTAVVSLVEQTVPPKEHCLFFTDDRIYSLFQSGRPVYQVYYEGNRYMATPLKGEYAVHKGDISDMTVPSAYGFIHKDDVYVTQVLFNDASRMPIGVLFMKKEDGVSEEWSDGEGYTDIYILSSKITDPGQDMSDVIEEDIEVPLRTYLHAKAHSSPEEAELTYEGDGYTGWARDTNGKMYELRTRRGYILGIREAS